MPAQPAPLKREETQFFVPGMSSRTPNSSERNLLRQGSSGSLLPRSASARRRDKKQAKELAQLRLLRRDAPFHQSGGHIYMHRAGGVGILLALQDYFHVALSMPIGLLFVVCVVLYTLNVLIWTIFYMFADHPDVQCGIAPLGERPEFYHAFWFALITMTTIGYDLPSGFPSPSQGIGGGEFFEDQCSHVFVGVYLQSMAYILMHACVVGTLFGRVGTATSRASQIVFSNKAVVRAVRSRFYFMFQLAETSYFSYEPVVECHVRVYAILHEEIRMIQETGKVTEKPKVGDNEPPEGSASKPKAVVDRRLLESLPPSVKLGQHVELKRSRTTALPGVGARRDRDAPPGRPGARRSKERGSTTSAPEMERAYFQTRVMRLTNPNDELGGMLFLATPQVVSHRIDRWSPLFPAAARTDDPKDHDGNAYHFPGLVFREADRDVQQSDHHAASAKEQRFSKLGTDSMRRAGSGAIEFAATGAKATRGQLKRMQELIRQHLQRSRVEVIIVVEAIDPHSGNNFQARHSYTAEDIEFDKNFTACMGVDSETGMAHLDWNKFHALYKVPFNASQVIGGSHS